MGNQIFNFLSSTEKITRICEWGSGYLQPCIWGSYSDLKGSLGIIGVEALIKYVGNSVHTFLAVFCNFFQKKCRKWQLNQKQIAPTVTSKLEFKDKTTERML